MPKVEVYKTNVNDPSKADAILDEIHRELPESYPSFDLDDCDKVFRIEYKSANTNGEKLALIFERFGYHLEPLP